MNETKTEIKTTLEETIKAIVARGWKFNLSFNEKDYPQYVAVVFAGDVGLGILQSEAVFNKNPQEALQQAEENLHGQLAKLLNG